MMPPHSFLEAASLNDGSLTSLAIVWEQGSQGVPQVFQSHLEAALAAARPSVPSTERARLEGIYSRFLQSRDPGIGNAAVSAKGKGKRATLA